jgi:cbb3-type cytochrome oxidase maturation protein
MSLGLLIALSLALGVAAWLFFVWTVRSGQYDDPEGAKYRMLEDDEGERKPARRPGGGDGERPGAGPAGTHRGPERSP